VLASSERYYLERGRRPNKLADRAQQWLLMVRSSVPRRRIVAAADNRLAAPELLKATRRKCWIVTCLQLDAALNDSLP
jgi:hypothetical protein